MMPEGHPTLKDFFAILAVACSKLRILPSVLKTETA